MCADETECARPAARTEFAALATTNSLESLVLALAERRKNVTTAESTIRCAIQESWPALEKACVALGKAQSLLLVSERQLDNTIQRIERLQTLTKIVETPQFEELSQKLQDKRSKIAFEALHGAAARVRAFFESEQYEKGLNLIKDCGKIKCEPCPELLDLARLEQQGKDKLRRYIQSGDIWKHSAANAIEWDNVVAKLCNATAGGEEAVLDDCLTEINFESHSLVRTDVHIFSTLLDLMRQSLAMPATGTNFPITNDDILRGHRSYAFHISRSLRRVRALTESLMVYMLLSVCILLDLDKLESVPSCNLNLTEIEHYVVGFVGCEFLDYLMGSRLTFESGALQKYTVLLKAVPRIFPHVARTCKLLLHSTSVRLGYRLVENNLLSLNLKLLGGSDDGAVSVEQSTASIRQCSYDGLPTPDRKALAFIIYDYIYLYWISAILIAEYIMPIFAGSGGEAERVVANILLCTDATTQGMILSNILDCTASIRTMMSTHQTHAPTYSLVTQSRFLRHLDQLNSAQDCLRHEGLKYGIGTWSPQSFGMKLSAVSVELRASVLASATTEIVSMIKDKVRSYRLCCGNTANDSIIKSVIDVLARIDPSLREKTDGIHVPQVFISYLLTPLKPYEELMIEASMKDEKAVEALCCRASPGQMESLVPTIVLVCLCKLSDEPALFGSLTVVDAQLVRADDLRQRFVVWLVCGLVYIATVSSSPTRLSDCFAFVAGTLHAMCSRLGTPKIVEFAQEILSEY